MKTEFCLGIDVGKNKHQATLINENAQIVGETIKFENNQTSFEAMLSKIQSSVSNKEKIKVGMESTGHYWINLHNFLKDNGLEFIQIINPIETQQLSKKRIRKVKNDRIDSLGIAKIVLEKNESNFVQNEKVIKLKKITRFWDKLKGQEKYYKREIKQLLELICPEFETFFSNIFCKTALAILNKYPDFNKFANLNKKKFVAFVSSTSKGRINEKKALNIVATIKTSIGLKNNDELSVMQLKMLLANLAMVQGQVLKVRDKIASLSDNFECKKRITSIPGVSDNIAAVVISEIGDIHRFKNKDKLTAFAGLDASVFESGNYKRKEGNRISKRGSKYLRKQLYYAAKTAALHDPELKKFYDKKIAEGKHYNVVIIAIARKILHRIYRVWKDDRNYEIRKP